MSSIRPAAGKYLNPSVKKNRIPTDGCHEDNMAAVQRCIDLELLDLIEMFNFKNDQMKLGLYNEGDGSDDTLVCIFYKDKIKLAFYIIQKTAYLYQNKLFFVGYDKYQLHVYETGTTFWLSMLEFDLDSLKDPMPGGVEDFEYDTPLDEILEWKLTEHYLYFLSVDRSGRETIYRLYQIVDCQVRLIDENKEIPILKEIWNKL